MRRFFYDLLALIVIALLGAFASAGLGLAQPPGLYQVAVDHIIGVRATSSDLCGRETRTATGYVRVQCIDYPMLRRTTGATMFPDQKGQQVWVRSSDPTVKAYRIAMTYRKAGHLDTVVQFAEVHPTYDSGASWVLGDIEIVSVEVTELRESAKVAVQ